MAANTLFEPQNQATVSITCAVTTARVALPSLTGPLTTRSLRIKNVDATNIAYINWGDSTVTATVPNGATPGSMPIGAGETVGISIPPTVTNIAAICTAGTPLVFFTPGYGL